MSAVEVAFSVEGNGPPLYMVHGIGSRKEGWNDLIAHLSDEFTCVTHDLRGHGESPAPSTPYSLDELVEDLEALRNKLGHQQIHVIGHSLGGMIGPSYARTHPDRILSVGLLSTAAGRTEEDRAKLSTLLTALESKGAGSILDLLVDRWFSDAFLAKRPDAVEARLQQVRETLENVFRSVFHIYAETEMGPWLHELTCPCLVLTGELDGGCNPRLNRFIANELQDAELVILDGLKHSILIEASDRVAVPVREFLMRHNS